MMATTGVPWVDCKITFDVDDVTKVEAWFYSPQFIKGKGLPNGWVLRGLDFYAGTVTFDVEGMPHLADAEAVKYLLQTIQSAA